jgi:hypothetical protein
MIMVAVTDVSKRNTIAPHSVKTAVLCATFRTGTQICSSELQSDLSFEYVDVYESVALTKKVKQASNYVL